MVDERNERISARKLKVIKEQFDQFLSIRTIKTRIKVGSAAPGTVSLTPNNLSVGN